MEISSDFELESGNGNVDRQTNGQTNRRNYTNFERILAMILTNRQKNRQTNGGNYTNLKGTSL